MVCLLTPDYYVAFANRAFREKFGESKGRHCHEYCFGKTDPCEFCESFIPLKTGNPHHWVPTTAEGLVIDAYDFPFTDVDGSKMILEMDIDVTEQVNLQKQLKDSERLATIGATAGMVGHDIRNPLQAITGDLYLAKTDLASIPESEEKQTIQESLTEIEKNIDYINKIVADLQDFARPLKPNAEETDLKLIIDQLLTKNGLPDDVQVTVKVEPDAGKFVADSTFINRIMYNLVSNAVQAMPKGGKLTIRAYKEASDVVIDVTDTGSGIPEAVKGKLFTPMFTTKAKGQGFGLPVIKRMTESLGGTVSFESQEGKGTTFTVRLPSPEVNGKWIYKQ
jgi:signal transduction histidine kinase